MSRGRAKNVTLDQDPWNLTGTINTRFGTWIYHSTFFYLLGKLDRFKYPEEIEIKWRTVFINETKLIWYRVYGRFMYAAGDWSKIQVVKHRGLL